MFTQIYGGDVKFIFRVLKLNLSHVSENQSLGKCPESFLLAGSVDAALMSVSRYEVEPIWAQRALM